MISRNPVCISWYLLACAVESPSSCWPKFNYSPSVAPVAASEPATRMYGLFPTRPSVAFAKPMNARYNCVVQQAGTGLLGSLWVQRNDRQLDARRTRHQYLHLSSSLGSLSLPSFLSLHFPLSISSFFNSSLFLFPLVSSNVSLPCVLSSSHN